MPVFRRAHRSRAATAALTVLLCLTAVGCDNAELTGQGLSGNPSAPASTSSTTSPATSTADEPHLTDYAPLLLQAEDLSDEDDTFAARDASDTGSDVPGASTLFVNADDTRAISATIAMYPGAPTATATLKHAVETAGTIVTGGNPQPLSVGTDGTMIKGTSPDGSKAVTLVLFTLGPALARIEFDSAIGDPTTDQFVTDVAKMQHIALRVGLPAGQ